MFHLAISHLNRQLRLLCYASLLLACTFAPMLAAFAAGPTPVTNNGLTVPQGKSATITSSELQTSNDDASPEQIFYHLDNAPAHGDLLLNGAPVSAGGTFTQADVNANRLSYSHNGNATTTDTFAYSVWNTSRASLTTNGAESDNNVYCPHISSDGRYVSFHTNATNLVSGDTNGLTDVFVRDRQNNTTTRVSVASNGAQANGHSTCSSISADGRYVAFESDATNLVSNDTNNATDVFVRDRQNNITTRVSVSSNGTQGNKASVLASISANGNFVAFQSDATNLVNGDTGNFTDVFVHEMQTGKTTRVSVRFDGSQTNEKSFDPSISADGQVVAFGSWAGDLTNLPGDTYTGYNIYVRDSRNNTTVRASIASNNAPGTGGEVTGLPTISANGRYVAFASQADDLVGGDTNNVEDLFVHDLQTGQTVRASVASNGAQAVGGNSSEPTLSADGRYVAFTSAATNLDPRCAAGGVFLHDFTTMKTTCVAVASSDVASNNSSDSPSISGDGRYVAFRSDATNLVSGNDTNKVCDIFVYDSGFSATFAINITPVAGTVPAPTITSIANQTILENTSTGPLPFAVNAANTTPDALVIDATSSNPELVPSTGIVIGGSGANRTITVTPAQTNAANPATIKRQGTATITIRVSDGTNTANTNFLLTVTPPPWLALLYLNGDDAPSSRSLSEPVRALLQRLRYGMPYNPNVRLVVLYDGNENIPNGSYGDSRVYVRDPNALTDVSLSLASLGSTWPNFPANFEMNTGSASTVSSFIRWARATYPTAHTFLSMIDHGGGWAPDLPPAQPRAGGWGAGGWRGMSVDYTSDFDSLSTRNLREALRDSFDSGQRLDVLFLDACLMGMSEVAYEVRDYADYMVAGENLLYATLPYQDYLGAGSVGATTAPQELASHIVDRYNNNDPEKNPFTISAVDLGKLRGTGPNSLPTAVNTLADRMLAALPPSPVPLDNPVRAAFTAAYTAAQKFDYDSSLTIDPTDGYVDLADFARNLRDSSNIHIPDDVRTAASTVYITIVQAGPDQVVIGKRSRSNFYNGQLWDFSGAYGLSIFLPLGEEDYRPTKPDPNNLNNALPERQLTYYVNPEQLAWAGAAPQWSALLERLEANTPIRAPGGLAASITAGSGTVDQRPFTTPALLPIPKRIYLPIVSR